MFQSWFILKTKNGRSQVFYLIVLENTELFMRLGNCFPLYGSLKHVLSLKACAYVI